MLLAEGMTIADWIHANTALISSALSLAFITVCGGIGWYFREVWKANKERSDLLAKHEIDRAARRSFKEETLLDVMAEHVPKQTQTLGTLSELVRESRQKDSDVLREVMVSQVKIDELGSALVEHGCPDSKEVMAARLSPYVDRAQKRADEIKNTATIAAQGLKDTAGSAAKGLRDTATSAATGLRDTAGVAASEAKGVLGAAADVAAAKLDTSGHKE